MEHSTEPQLPKIEAGKKRTFPLEVRRQIVDYYDSLLPDGSKGAYLRRYGLYEKSIMVWRKQLATTHAPQPGRKQLTATEKELRSLRTRNSELEAELKKANAIIDVQKKVSALLEMHVTPTE